MRVAHPQSGNMTFDNSESTSQEKEEHEQVQNELLAKIVAASESRQKEILASLDTQYSTSVNLLAIVKDTADKVKPQALRFWTLHLSAVCPQSSSPHSELLYWLTFYVYHADKDFSEFQRVIMLLAATWMLLRLASFTHSLGQRVDKFMKVVDT